MYNFKFLAQMFGEQKYGAKQTLNNILTSKVGDGQAVEDTL